MFFSRLLNVSKYFIDSSKDIKVFFVRINSNRFTTKLLFYCFLSYCFLSLFRSKYFCRYVHFHQFLLRAFGHENISQSYNLEHFIVFVYFLLQMNSLFLLAVIVVFFVKMASHCLNPILVLNLWGDVVLQFIITLTDIFSFIKVTLTCLVGSSTSLYLCFLWFELHFVVISSQFLWSYTSSICFS